MFGENPCIYDTIGKKQKPLLHTHTHTVVHNYFTTIQAHKDRATRFFFQINFSCINSPSKPHMYSVVIAFSTAASNWRS